MWEAMARTGTWERYASNRPLMRCRFPGPACADSQLAGQSCLGSSGEGRSLLMTNVDPVDTALDRTAGPANCINDGVQGVTDDAVDPSHPRIEELLDELFGNIHERDLHGTDDI